LVEKLLAFRNAHTSIAYALKGSRSPQCKTRLKQMTAFAMLFITMFTGDFTAAANFCDSVCPAPAESSF
jgi:hypothetical protein